MINKVVIPKSSGFKFSGFKMSKSAAVPKIEIKTPEVTIVKRKKNTKNIKPAYKAIFLQFSKAWLKTLAKSSE